MADLIVRYSQITLMSILITIRLSKPLNDFVPNMQED